MPHPSVLRWGLGIQQWNVIQSLSGEGSRESEVSLWPQMAWGLSVCLNHTITCFVGKTRREKNGPMKLRLQNSRHHTLSHWKQEVYLWHRGWGQGTLYKWSHVSSEWHQLRIISRLANYFPWQNVLGMLAVYKNKLNANVKWNLTICRKYKLTQATYTPKAALKGEPCWRAFTGLVLCPRTS